MISIAEGNSKDEDADQTSRVFDHLEPELQLKSENSNHEKSVSNSNAHSRIEQLVSEEMQKMDESDKQETQPDLDEEVQFNDQVDDNKSVGYESKPGFDNALIDVEIKKNGDVNTSQPTNIAELDASRPEVELVNDNQLPKNNIRGRQRTHVSSVNTSLNSSQKARLTKSPYDRRNTTKPASSQLTTSARRREQATPISPNRRNEDNATEAGFSSMKSNLYDKSPKFQMRKNKSGLPPRQVFR